MDLFELAKSSTSRRMPNHQPLDGCQIHLVDRFLLPLILLHFF
jgi:hypothetical protein